MRPIVQGIAALLAITLAFPASAGLGPNGLGPNGLGPNGLGPNGLGPNGLGPNGLGPNGLGPNGLGPNGLGPNGLGPNGLGPNGLGPNGLGPNGLDVNGLGPNGLGPNGLGPNGLVYLITPAGVQLTYDEGGAATGVARDSNQNLIPVPTYFGAWFDTDPVAASQYMRYYARCAYDASTAIAWVDGTGRTHAWSGQYGFAMASLMAGMLEPLGTCDATGADPGQISPRCSQQIRARMTADEGKWVSSCILAHVNVQGTHQYISLRGNPPNLEAQAALKPSPGELWTMRPVSVYFGNLFDGARDLTGTLIPNGWNQWAALNTGEALEVTPMWNRISGVFNIVLGRACDAEGCGYYDEAGTYHPVIANPFVVKDLVKPGTTTVRTYLTHSGSAMGEFGLEGIQTDPVLAFDSVARYALPWTPAEIPNRPIFVGMPMYDPFHADQQPGPMEREPESFRSTGTVAIDPGQYVASAGDQFSPGSLSARLVGLRAGQALEQVRAAPDGLALGNPQVPLDMNEAFTVIVRYANPRATPAAARVEVSSGSGAMIDAGTEIWPSTGSSTEYTWLQVYPVRLYQDASGGVSLKVRYSGAVAGEQCTGSKLLKGDGETGNCALKSIYFDWKRLKVMCRESGESKPVCRGDLIFDYRNRKWGWFCAYGGKALLACTGADAPELDVASLIPGKPYCMPDAATSFVGVCK